MTVSSSVHLRAVLAGQRLSSQASFELFTEVCAGNLSHIETAALLGALQARGEDAQEIAGAAAAFRTAAIPLSTRQRELIDVVGTGGDCAGTVNISTAAAILGAAMGLSVAKHGNRAVSSQAGAADVIAALGIPLQLAPSAVSTLLEETGFAFLFAQLYHPAMRNVAPVRAALSSPTIFNILGPLLNPAPLDYQLVGVGNPKYLEDIAQALTSAPLARAVAVHGDGLDEVALDAPTQIREIVDGQVRSYSVTPQQLGLSPSARVDLVGGNAAENAELIRNVFAGGGVPAQRDAIAVTTGLMLYVSGRANTWAQGTGQALEKLATGTVNDFLDKVTARAQELYALQRAADPAATPAITHSHLIEGAQG